MQNRTRPHVRHRTNARGHGSGLRRMIRAAGLALGLTALAAPMGARAADVTVFAAASLRDALGDGARAYGAETGHEIRLSLAGSSALARQIEAGAPADVFISANAAWMDALAAKGLIREASRVDLLGNRLVLVAPLEAQATAEAASEPASDPEASGAAPADLAATEIGPDFDLMARLGEGRLAMALVEAVPAGIYGRAALTSLGLWGAVSGQLAEADNVRAALALVALGAAPLGIVYATDAIAEPRVQVVGVFPAGSHPPIRYPGALVSGAPSPEAGAAFLAWLAGPAGQRIFRRHGFRITDG